MLHRPTFVSSVLVGAALALATTPYARAAEPEVLAEHWDLVRMNNAPAGHAHTLVKRVGTAEAPEIETSVVTQIQMARLGQTLSIDETVVTRERPDGSLVSIHKRQKQSNVESVVEVTFTEGKAVMATTVMGQKREASVPVPPGTFGPRKSEQVLFSGELKPGAKREVRSFVVDLGGPALSTATVAAAEEVETIAGKQSLVRLDVTLDVMPLRQAIWIDREGAPRVTRLEIAGMVVETRRGTKEQVLSGKAAKEGKEAGPEVFVDTLIRTRHLIPHARAIDSALMHVKLKRADVKLPSLEDERQKVESREADGSLLVRVKRVVPAAGATGKRPPAVPTPEIAPYLVATSMLQADDPMIQKAAAEAVGSETDAWKASQSIEAWVYKAIGKKSMGVGFASALEVCRDREGDCTEHAVLVAALARAAGIPSRVALGLEYLTGILGGHAWTEVWIEGQWYALDATLGTGSTDALHLTLGRLALAEGTHGREYASFIDAMGGMDVDVREVTWQGKTLRLDRPEAVVADGTRYLNRLWGLSVEAPSGFELRAREPFKGLSQRLVQLKGKTATGTERKLKVQAESLMRGETLADAVPRKAILKDGTIDGRPARIGEKGEGRERTRVAYVLDDVDSFFSFELEPFEGADDEVFFELVLKGVDLDAGEPATTTSK